MAFAAVVFVIMAAVHWLGKDSTPVAAEPIEDPVRDAQEWAAYPRPEDKGDR